MKAQTDYCIRQAVAADLSAIRRCAELSYACYIARMGRKPAPMVADFTSAIASEQVDIITSQSAELLGFMVSYPKHHHFFLENIAIDPGYQQLGLGRRLLNHCEYKARLHGYTSIELYTNEKMTENLAWYPRRGYVETERKVENGFHRVYFRKTLSL